MAGRLDLRRWSDFVRQRSKNQACIHCRHGLIDDVRVYDRALSADDVAALARLTSASRTTYAYDAAGRLLALTDPAGNTTSYAYDNLGRMIEETNELAETRYFVYNAAGLLVEKTDRDGRVTQYEYDDLGRLLAENWLDESEQVVYTISYTYDAAGRISYSRGNGGNGVRLRLRRPRPRDRGDANHRGTDAGGGIRLSIRRPGQPPAIRRHARLRGRRRDRLLLRLAQSRHVDRAIRRSRRQRRRRKTHRLHLRRRRADTPPSPATPISPGPDLVATATYTFDDLGRLTDLVTYNPTRLACPIYDWTSTPPAT